MKLTEDNIKSKFHEYNSVYFENKLIIPTLKFNKSSKTLAMVKYNIFNNKYHCDKLIFSENILWNEELFSNILVHEMIHIWQIQEKNRVGHGYFFKKKMNELNKQGFNITIKADPNSFNLIKNKNTYIVISENQNNYYLISLAKKPKPSDSLRIQKIINNENFIFEGFVNNSEISKYPRHRSFVGRYKITQSQLDKILP